MSAPSSLEELYLEEMQDLWSANDQMTKALKQTTEHVHDSKLKELLQRSLDGIAKHTAVLKDLIEANGGSAKPEHCKGMEGLVAEALKHGVKEAPKDGTLRDIGIIAQYQRMSHYGLAGFGSAAAYAKALGKKADAAKLATAISEIYKGDEYATKLADHLEMAAA